MEYKWREVAEELPEIEEPVIVAYETTQQKREVTVAFMIHEAKVSGQEIAWVEHEWLLDGVTHWKPLPEHPLDTQERLLEQNREWEREDFGFIEPEEFSD